jgi:hypothetical protein
VRPPHYLQKPHSHTAAVKRFLYAVQANAPSRRKPTMASSEQRFFAQPVIEMTKSMFIVLYIVVLIAVVVGVDLLFFKNRLWERLMVNVGIVLVFAAFYLRFLKTP